MWMCSGGAVTRMCSCEPAPLRLASRVSPRWPLHTAFWGLPARTAPPDAERGRQRRLQALAEQALGARIRVPEELQEHAALVVLGKLLRAARRSARVSQLPRTLPSYRRIAYQRALAAARSGGFNLHSVG